VSAFDGQTELLSTVLMGVVLGPEPGAAPARTWSDARAALAASTGEKEADIAAAVASEDGAALRAIVDQWLSNQRNLPEHDREVLKHALKAFRKRMKLTLLEAESSVAGGAMSAGRRSNIVGIKPPERFPRAVWEELVRQKRLLAGRNGTYELPPE